MIKKILIASIFIFICDYGYSQQYFFSAYSIEQGLSQSVVNCLFQDSKGYLWMGTQNGLNKFDGYNFEIFSYNPTDTNTISNNWVYSINEDQEGNLWIGTKSGLNKFIRSEKRFERIYYKTSYPNDVSEYVYDAIPSGNGLVIINTPPVLTIYDSHKKEFNHYFNNLEFDGAVKDNHIPLLEDSEGLIWVGSAKGLSCFNRKEKQFTNYLRNGEDLNSISDNNITALFEDKHGDIWIGTSNGLNKYDKNTKAFVKYFNEPKNKFSLSNNFIRAIAEDKSGNLWIGTEGSGLLKMTNSKDGKAIFEEFSSKNNGLSHNIVLALMVDKSQNLWVGTLQGVSKTDLKKRKFQLYRESSSPYSVNLLGNVIASIYKDEKNILWVGNWGQGLNLFNRKTGEVEHFSSREKKNHYLPNDFVHVIFEDGQKRVWLGTRDGIFIYQKGKNCFIRLNEFFANKHLSGFQGIRIYSIIQDKAGNYWIGTQTGLFKINLTIFTTELFQKEAEESHKISSNLIYCLLEDRDGLIWIATLDGLDVYHPKSGEITHYKKSKSSTNSLCDNFVISLCEDHKGNIWIGTSTYVNEFVKKDSAFVYYSQKNGLPNNRIFEILEDHLHNLWFATGNGLSRFDTLTNSFRTYTVDEGLQSPEFNLRASFKSKDGEVFFGGMNGFNSFFPDSLNDNPFVPAIVFTSFHKNQGGKEVLLDVENKPEVVLHYNDYPFTIEFAALEFTNPEKNNYVYRMLGVSDEWINIENRRFVPFSNLPPGEYTFQVKCSNNDGKWSEELKSLKIIILPPWWKTWFAYFSYGVIIVFVIIIVVFARERKVKRVRILLEQKVQQRTLQIEKQKAEILEKNVELKQLNATKDKFFSILAHDLRNPFNSILGITNLMITDYNNYDKQRIIHYLSSIKDVSEHAYELLQNLLFWARSQTGSIEFHPVVFDVANRINENIELAESQANKKNIQIRSTVNEGQTMTGDINMIDTVLRNLLTNAIKFTPQNGQVVISMKETDGYYDLSIKDTGIGIAAENISRIFKIDSKFSTKGTEKETGTGLGLSLCKEFIERHGGNIRVESEPGHGSTFFVALPK